MGVGWNKGQSSQLLLWGYVREMIRFPSADMDTPYAWHPSVVDVQLLRVGQLVIAAVPGEFTTMAGRRLKDAVKAKAQQLGMPSDTKVKEVSTVTTSDLQICSFCRAVVFNLH